MIYSEVVERGLILPKKNKYTIRDLNALIINSLFGQGVTLSPGQAAFIIKCSAIYHGTDYSKSIK